MDERATDERAALEELERLQQQIQHYKSQRQAVGEEFERFIRSFTASRDAAAPPAVVPAPRPAASTLASLESPAESRESTAPSSRDAVTAAAAALPARRQTGHRTGVLIGGALALLAGGALVTWTLRPRAPAPSTTSTVTPAAPPALPAPEPQPSSATPATAESALVTTRAVWVRVLADGGRVIERELPPNARVPLKAERTIVVRTGDAGAIRIILRGQDQGVLGRAGEVVTRTFNVPAPQAR